MTLFNRGVTNPGLFPGLERLRGDRTRADGLAALRGSRVWDAVIDTWQDSPAAVAAVTAALAGRVGHYAYISSIAVYGGANFRRPGFDEASLLPDPGPLPGPEQPALVYPQRKLHAERLIASAIPNAHSLHRAHGIVGLDARGRLDHPEIGLSKAWWPVRVGRGGPMLAPGEPTDTTQYTDVLDLARFVIHCIDQARTGPYNVCATATFRDYLAALRHEAGSAARFIWVDHRFLFSRGLQSFTDIPMWVSHHEVENAFYQASTQRALNAGLITRSIAATFGPIRRAFFTHHSDYDFGNADTGFGLARRETEILGEWQR